MKNNWFLLLMVSALALVGCGSTVDTVDNAAATKALIGHWSGKGEDKNVSFIYTVTRNADGSYGMSYLEMDEKTKTYTLTKETGKWYVEKGMLYEQVAGSPGDLGEFKLLSLGSDEIEYKVPGATEEVVETRQASPKAPTPPEGYKPAAQ